jgi:hypothetical protein
MTPRTPPHPDWPFDVEAVIRKLRLRTRSLQVGTGVLCELFKACGYADARVVGRVGRGAVKEMSSNGQYDNMVFAQEQVQMVVEWGGGRILSLDLHTRWEDVHAAYHQRHLPKNLQDQDRLWETTLTRPMPPPELPAAEIGPHVEQGLAWLPSPPSPLLPPLPTTAPLVQAVQDLMGHYRVASHAIGHLLFDLRAAGHKAKAASHVNHDHIQGVLRSRRHIELKVAGKNIVIPPAIHEMTLYTGPHFSVTPVVSIGACEPFIGEERRHTREAVAVFEREFLTAGLSSSPEIVPASTPSPRLRI